MTFSSMIGSKPLLIWTSGRGEPVAAAHKRWLAGNSIERIKIIGRKPEEVLDEVAALRKLEGLWVAVDFKGPRCTVDEVSGGSVYVKPWQEIVLVDRASKHLPSDKIWVRLDVELPSLKTDDVLRVAGSTVELRLLARRDHQDGWLFAEVRTAGELTSNRGINIIRQGCSLTRVGPEILAPGDFEFLELLASRPRKEWPHLLIASMLEIAQDVRLLKKILADLGLDLPVWVKIENAKALANVKAIAQVANGLLLGRDDLRKELDPERIPEAREEVFWAGRAAGIDVAAGSWFAKSLENSEELSPADVEDLRAHIHFDAILLALNVPPPRQPEVIATISQTLRHLSQTAPQEEVELFELPQQVFRALLRARQ